LVAAVYGGVRFVGQQAARKESRVLGELLRLRSELSAKPENLAQLEKLAGSKKYSRLAYILMATHWVEKGELAKAQESLAKIGSSPRDFIYYQAQDLAGRVFALQKEYDKALAVFQKIEEDEPGDYCLEPVLFHKAETLEKKGDRSAALAVYKKIQEQFPQSYLGYDAAERARKLEATK
jgi:predicted negative regulator of RcsB-dependent stress response